MTGKQYKTAREKLGLTRVELAEKMELTERTVFRLEASKRVSNRDALAMAALSDGMKPKTKK